MPAIKCNFRKLIFVVLIATGCRQNPVSDEPSFVSATTWMHQALKERNGIEWRGDQRPLANLTSDGCKLIYEDWPGDTITVDLSDVNPKTITVKKIGPNPWVVFDTRDFHRSVKYHTAPDSSGLPADYDAPDGGFALNSEDVAQSFSNALARAVQLCGGRPSTF